ncbi:MAG: hypothetical protein PHQ40_02660 [Anaerolineaceae bacterium]|nr:hypothetical protein [Anaerolineaceae bacterium]
MIFSDFQFQVTSDDVLAAQGADPDRLRARRPALVELTEQAVEIGQDLIQPVALLEVFAVKTFHHHKLRLMDGRWLSGPLVAQHLAGAGQVALVLATLGPEIDRRIESLMSTDPFTALALDTYGSVAAELLGQELCTRISQMATDQGLKRSMALSPGMIGWPVEVGQKELFNILQPEPSFLQLTSGFQMIPRKSISRAMGLGAEMNDSLDPCDYCAGRGSCAYRYRGHVVDRMAE